MSPMQSSAPPGTVSSDGRWIWNGVQWVPALGVPMAPPFLNTGGGPSEPPGERRSGLAIVGGIMAIVAEAIILISYLTPYATYDGFGTQPSYDYALFYGCVFSRGASTCNYTALPWGIATAGIMIAFGLAFAILMIVMKRRVLTSIAAGALTALGTQELFDWMSYVAVKDYPGAHLGVAMFVGVFGALVLVAAGVAGVIGAWQRQTAH